MNWKKIFSAFLLTILLNFTPLVVTSALAVFDATINAIISESQGITITIQQPAGTEIDDYTIYRIQLALILLLALHLPVEPKLAVALLRLFFQGSSRLSRL